MSEFLYSEVDPNVWLELNARGQTGRFNRQTNDLNYMLDKVANVVLIPYELDKKNPDIKYTIKEAILGGNGVRGGEYLPSGESGFLNDRIYGTTSSFFGTGDKLQTTSETRVNKSHRIPPFISSADVSIGDHSMGLLNKATINLVIPNPERDLNYIESVYFKPGRYVSVVIEYPQSVIVSMATTHGKLSGKSLPSLDKLINLDSTFQIEDIEKYNKMNVLRFDGLIQSFDISYQSDMTVTSTIQLIGSSNVYTDISLILETSDSKQDPNKPITPADTPDAAVLEKTSFYKKLFDEVDTQLNADISKSALSRFGYKIDSNFRSQCWYHAEEPATGLAEQRYITLGWLVEYINRIILEKSKITKPNAKVVFTSGESLCQSIYYENIISSNPMKIYFPDKKCRTYGNTLWFPDTDEYKKDDRTLKFLDAEKGTSYPDAIFINIELINTLVDTLEANQNLTVSTLLAAVSSEVAAASGGAIDLQLMTHSQNDSWLIWYDVKAVKVDEMSEAVKPYPVPMFANHPSGTIVRDFKFTGALPQDASNLSYVLNQDPSKIAESDIAPFVSYMYSANTVSRSGPHETISAMITQEELDNINKQYKDAHIKYVNELKSTSTQFGTDVNNTDYRIALHNALKKYIQYPTPSIVDTNKIAAPVIPFDVEFTIDGIHGLRYGDVLTFDGLPDRYKKNVVFSIANVTHTVSTKGEWTTTVRCLTRTKIQ
jgi:hypothetical protein